MNMLYMTNIMDIIDALQTANVSVIKEPKDNKGIIKQLTWLNASPGLQSTAMSMRATKKCWWTGAYNPGAMVVPYFLVSPGCKAPKLRIPVSLTSASILPSYNKHPSLKF